MPGTAYTAFQTRSYRNFDKLGRPTEVYRQYNGSANAATLMYRVQYDMMGRVGKKILSPNYNGGAGIETLDYTYNLHGQLIGINKDYALSNDDYAQWDHYFGVYLGYDNRAGLFTGNQYNGQLSGQIWKTQGDNTPRKWDYTYDAAGRFTGAAFTQKATPSDYNWANGTIDCSVSNITYDANGNLLTMNRKGILPGNSGGVVVDDLAYHYQQISGGGEWTNKLETVTDVNHGLGSQNGTLADFKDANISGADYDYDANGNTTNDRNKDIKQGSGAGIEWNYMDKIQVMHISPPVGGAGGGRTVSYIYDASGAKLGKTVTPVSGPAHTTWYMGSYLYEETAATGIVLKYILHEEGRIRLLTPQNTFATQVPGLELSGSLAMPNGQQGAMEWMLKDQQGSTRMVLTEEVHREYHECSMETNDPARKDYEERTFGNVDDNGNIPISNEVVATREVTPPYWNYNTSNTVSALIANSNGAAIGPNVFLKVMAGDQVSASVDYLFSDISSQGPKPDREILRPLVDILINNFNNSIAGNSLKNNTAAVQGQLSLTGGLGSFLQSQDFITNMPKAYLTWLFFDEQMNFIPPDGLGGGSGSRQIEQEGDGGYNLSMQQVKAPKNGYAFVYVSNQNRYKVVYFDNLKVTHERGRILEENTYYPDGLKIAGLCAKAAGKLPNEFGYQGNYAEEEEESGYDEFALRTYDPTIGRWLSTDPYDEVASPYVGMGADPVNNVDPDGGMAMASAGEPLRVWNHVVPSVGQFSGTAQATSLSAGSSASSSAGSSGGSASGGALNAAGNMIAGYLGQMVANKLFPLPKGPDAAQLQSSCGGKPSSGSSGGGQQPSTPSQPVPQNGGGCNCPPGYGPTPSAAHPNEQPLYLDPDDVALDWSYSQRPAGMHGNVELSSLIYAVDVLSGHGTAKTALYGATRAVQNPPTTDTDHDPYGHSPNAASPLHGPRPRGSRLVGHIHLHEAITAGDDQFNLNNSFSDGDKGLFETFPKLIHYVLGALGNLYGHYPSTLRNKDNTGWDDRAGTEDKVSGGQGMYKSGLIKPDVCRCYKQ